MSICWMSHSARSPCERCAARTRLSRVPFGSISRVRRGFRREAQNDLLGRLLKYAERLPGEGFQVELGGRRARLVEDFEANNLVEAEEHRLCAFFRPGDEIGARAEQEAVGNDLPPARRASIVELNHAAGEQRLAQGSERFGVGEPARADPAGEGLRRKLRLDIDGKTPPVGLAEARADLGAEQRRSAARPGSRTSSARAAFSSSASSSAEGAQRRIRESRAARA